MWHNIQFLCRVELLNEVLKILHEKYIRITAIPYSGVPVVLYRLTMDGPLERNTQFPELDLQELSMNEYYIKRVITDVAS